MPLSDYYIETKVYELLTNSKDNAVKLKSLLTEMYYEYNDKDKVEKKLIGIVPNIEEQRCMALLTLSGTPIENPEQVRSFAAQQSIIRSAKIIGEWLPRVREMLNEIEAERVAALADRQANRSNMISPPGAA